jgi:prevent-host-death family protein
VINQEPVTETVEITEATPDVSELVRAVARSRKRVVLEEDGTPRAAVLSFREYELFKQMKAERARRFKVLEEMRDAFKDVPPDEIEREVAKALAEVRAE